MVESSEPGVSSFVSLCRLDKKQPPKLMIKQYKEIAHGQSFCSPVTDLKRVLRF